MKIVTVVGARPQFIKAAAVSRIIRPSLDEVLIHTGQHYDKTMSDIFFDELNIPHPDYNLGVGSGSHAEQTAAMLTGIEKVLFKEKPDSLMVYGDTNSTLAGALAASKIHIPVIHVEAGLRSFNKRMPEEQNRVLTDHISSMLFCPTQTAVDNLKKEGIADNVFEVGDVMCDAVLFYSKENANHTKEFFLKRLIPLYSDQELPSEWYMATIHRAENTDNINKIYNILDAFNQLDSKVIFPVHPRTKNMVKELKEKYNYENVYFCEPMGYKDMLFFTANAKKIITDSGGLQKEAYILNTPCVTVRDQTEWVETLDGNNNILAKPETQDILKKIIDTIIDQSVKRNYYGNGIAAQKIFSILRG